MSSPEHNTTEKRGRGRPRNGFDKKKYDRERMRRIRAEKKMEKETK